MTGWKDKRRIMQRYDLTAKMYDERYAEEQQKKYKKTLEKVNVTGKIVLDVGCGSGLLFPEVASKAKFVLGLDISRQLLLLAKEQAKDLGDVFVVQADADNLPFADGFFDCVFAFTILQNMPKPSKTLSELKLVTKGKGNVAITALKKAFGLEEFMDLIEASGLQIAAFVDEENINCYIAVLGA